MSTKNGNTSLSVYGTSQRESIAPVGVLVGLPISLQPCHISHTWVLIRDQRWLSVSVDCYCTNTVFRASSAFGYRALTYPLSLKACSVFPFVTCSSGAWLHCAPSCPRDSFFTCRCLLLMAADVSWHFQPYSFVCHAFTLPADFTSFFATLLKSFMTEPIPLLLPFCVHAPLATQGKAICLCFCVHCVTCFLCQRNFGWLCPENCSKLTVIVPLSPVSRTFFFDRMINIFLPSSGRVCVKFIHITVVW